jgi:hypothetical protein
MEILLAICVCLVCVALMVVDVLRTNGYIKPELAARIEIVIFTGIIMFAIMEGCK